MVTLPVASEIKNFLRSPKFILGELTVLGAAGVAGALWPDLRLFQSVWFMALALLICLSLLVVALDQIRRRRTDAFVLHAGLLLIIAAGLSRALFAREAVVDLIEGETLPPAASAWSAQFPGLLAGAFHLDQPVTLEKVSGSRYPDGDLRELQARLSAGELAVNQQLQLGAKRLFLDQKFGPAALLEWSPGKREAVLLADTGRGHYEGTAVGPNGLRAHLRAQAARPEAFEIRVMRGNGLLAATALAVGSTLRLHGGASLTLHGAPVWARLHGSHDPALWLAYLGFALVLAGAVLLFVFKPLRGAGAPQPAPRPCAAGPCVRMPGEQRAPA